MVACSLDSVCNGVRRAAQAGQEGRVSKTVLDRHELYAFGAGDDVIGLTAPPLRRKV